MPASATTDSSQPNRRAVQRLFAEKRRQPPPPRSLSGAGHGGGARPTGASSGGPARPTSSMSLAAYHAAQQAQRRPGPGSFAGESASSGYGSGPRQQPAWVQVSSRECLQEPSLDVASHISQQLRLAAEMGAVLSGPGGGVAGLTAEQHEELLKRATAPGGCTAPAGDPTRSCFALHMAKRQHLVEVGARSSAGGAAAEGGLTRREQAHVRAQAYHHQQAIVRNEYALERKRAAAAYAGLTAAQADAAFVFPNAHTLDRLVAERYHGRWPLDNAQRQLLRRGEPLMTQIMRGDFYESYQGRASSGAGVAARRAASCSRGPPPRMASVNKRDVRVASAINAAVRRSRSCEARRRGDCHCAVRPVAKAAV